MILYVCYMFFNKDERHWHLVLNNFYRESPVIREVLAMCHVTDSQQSFSGKQRKVYV